MKNSVYEIETDRLILQNIKEEDANFIVNIRSNPNVYRYFIVPRKITLEEHLAWYKNKYIYDENRIDWVGTEKQTGRRIGIFGIKRENESKEIEISYILDCAMTGKGYAKESINAIIEFAKNNWNVKSAIALIHKDNLDSIKFAKVNSFSYKYICGDFEVFKREI